MRRACTAASASRPWATTSSNDGTSVTPELSGIFSNTFANNTIGIAVSASYQDREASFNQAATTSGWRGAYLGSANDWGTLPQNDPQATNRPGPNDVYSPPQNLNYSLNNIKRERINGQAVLQWEPVSNLRATVDYTYSENRIRTDRSELSVWFNFGDVTSSWTDGPVVGPIIYSEEFGPGKDLSFGGAQFASINVNESTGFNLAWSPTDRLDLELDIHSSSAESRPDSIYGSNSVIGMASFDLARQTIDFSHDLPVLNIELAGGGANINPALATTTGTSFRSSYMRTEIDQIRLDGSYALDLGFVKSVDFGVTHTENNVRSAFAVAQRDTWGGAGPPSDVPDDIFHVVSLGDVFDQIDGGNSSSMAPMTLAFDFDRAAQLIDTLYNACGGDGICRTDNYTTDRRTTEESTSAFFQINNEFSIGSMPANLIVGARYEETEITSQALVPVPTGTQWVANNEFGIIFGPNQDFTELTGSYDYFLPSIDFDVSVTDDIILRASYSKTITRPGYDSIQGGQTVNGLFRIDGGNGSQGNPGLLPYESANYDLTAEWYYDEASYFAAGYFRKDVQNFIGTSVIDVPAFNLPTPYGGPRYNAAVAALGGSTDATAIRNYILTNYPDSSDVTGTDSNGNLVGNIFGIPGEDPVLNFRVSVPVNQQEASVDGFEVAWQHMFGDSGFGGIVNYTIVQGDVEFDNTQPASVTQFALVGLSNSANVVAFYDKNGIQARIAYNWRDEFLASTIDPSGTPNNPVYVEPFGQIDLSASYDITEALTVLFEGINVTDEINRSHGRHQNQAEFVTQTGARYAVGLRYSF